jgi:hypothetical protein
MCMKAASSGADLVFLDLEDACAPIAKEGARATAVAALTGQDWGRTVRAVRINGIDTPWCHGDVIEVVTGARDALAKEGALAPGANYPRVEIEVLRADETSEGIAAPDTPSGHVPRARGSEVGIVARAWIARDAGGGHEADTGDMRSFDLVASPGEGDVLAAEAARHDDALRATARRLGQRLALRVLGHPVAPEP